MSRDEPSLHKPSGPPGAPQATPLADDPAEARLWTALRKRQCAGRRFRWWALRGRFYCVRERLAIEVDGAVHDDPVRARYDAERQTFLEEHGVTVLRFTHETCPAC